MADDKSDKKKSGRHVRKQGDAERKAGVLPERDLVENMRSDKGDLQEAFEDSKRKPGRHARKPGEKDGKK